LKVIEKIKELFLSKKQSKLTEKVNFKERVDLIQREIHKLLKESNFKKRGRTFNRETEKGIVQVLNFQMGQFPIGENYEIKGYRESYYGKFTINMGIHISEIFKLDFPDKEKSFFQDFDCQIRIRLPQLVKNYDYWWELNQKPEIITKEIIDYIENYGFNWFDQFKTRDNICQNLNEKSKIDVSRRTNLDKAIIAYYIDKKKGAEQFLGYFNKLDGKHKGHKEYVINLADKLNIKIK